MRRAALQPRTVAVEEARYEDRLAQRAELLELHAAVADYMPVLGQLAGDVTPSLERTREVRDLALDLAGAIASGNVPAIASSANDLYSAAT